MKPQLELPAELHLRLTEISQLKAIAALLEWDQLTQMPPKGNDARSAQLALLAGLVHDRLTDPRLGTLLDELSTRASGDEQALAREARRDRDRAVLLPGALVREISETSGKAHAAWVEARKSSKFSHFAPLLSRLIELRKQEAAALGYGPGSAKGPAYDALLDGYEPGATSALLDPLIARTRDVSRAALGAILGSRRRPKLKFRTRRCAIDAQRKLGVFVAQAMGYDLQAGRMDVSVHPFSTGIDIQDVRITTRYTEKEFTESLFSTIHEAGHALYEQGLPEQYRGTPLAEFRSMAIHESQSRLWENQIGRGLPFWKFAYPTARKLLGPVLRDIRLDDYYAAINAVRPSLIRTESDEVTYNLHIALRYELEQALFSGDLKTADLPGAWNAKMKEYLGIKPRKDAEGVLQDTHWAGGAFGYFPTYLLGNLYAAQWMATMRKAIAGLEKSVAKGKLGTVRGWLRENIHQQGRRYTTAELCRRVSGEDLDPRHFEEYLARKFGELYDVSW